MHAIFSYLVSTWFLVSVIGSLVLIAIGYIIISLAGYSVKKLLFLVAGLLTWPFRTLTGIHIGHYSDADMDTGIVAVPLPPRASVEPKLEKPLAVADDRTLALRMVGVLRGRVMELLIRKGVDPHTAKVLSAAYATDLRVGQVPFCDADGRSEFKDDHMPETGPLQTACHEIYVASQKVPCDKLAAELAQTHMPLYSGWGLGLST